MKFSRMSGRRLKPSCRPQVWIVPSSEMRSTSSSFSHHGQEEFDVVRVLHRMKQQRGVPKVLFWDNGSGFTSQAMDLWAYQNGMKIDFSRPGKPTDNSFVESFNGTFRAECLNAHWFGTLAEAKRLIEAWRQEYNESRPHRSLSDRTPTEFASEYAASRVLTAT